MERTLGKLKLLSRTVALVHRELEGSLLAVQLLLAQGAVALQQAGEMRIERPAFGAGLLTPPKRLTEGLQERIGDCDGRNPD